MEKLAKRGASSGPSPSWLDGLATWKLVLLVAGAAGAGVTVLMTGVVLIAVVGIQLTRAAPGTAAGNKNGALPILAACLLTEEPVTLTNVPRIRDVETMVELLAQLGADVEWAGGV